MAIQMNDASVKIKQSCIKLKCSMVFNTFTTMTFIFRDRMSVYYAVGLGRADSDKERELRNVLAQAS